MRSWQISWWAELVVVDQAKAPNLVWGARIKIDQNREDQKHTKETFAEYSLQAHAPITVTTLFLIA